MENEKPQIGTGMYILKEGKVLLGKRLSKNGLGQWCPPGGKLDLGEPVVDCAIRETKEETGIDVSSPRFIGYTDELEAGFVTMHFCAEWITGEPLVVEPDKFERWEWFDWNSLPTPLFGPVENFIKKGFNPNIV